MTLGAGSLCYAGPNWGDKSFPPYKLTTQICASHDVQTVGTVTVTAGLVGTAKQIAGSAANTDVTYNFINAIADGTLITNSPVVPQ